MIVGMENEVSPEEEEAADLLHIQSLLDLTCQTLADIEGKTLEDILRRMFGMENEVTPEEIHGIKNDFINQRRRKRCGGRTSGHSNDKSFKSPPEPMEMIGVLFCCVVETSSMTLLAS